VINVPPRGIGDKTLLGLQSAAQQVNASAGEVLMLLGKEGDKSPFWKSIGRGAIALADFGGMLSAWREALTSLSLPALFDRIISDTNYQAYIEDGSDEGTERWENVQELRRLAFEYSERGLVAFLENLALVSDQDTVPEQASAPTLLTLHAAKGLEFGQVFIIGLDEGILPHSRSLEEPEEMAEERRLFYVGITRARNQLYLVRANRRSTYGSYEESLPSRFLKNIPDNLVQRRGASRSQAYSWSSQDSRSSSGSISGWGRNSQRSQPARWESTPSVPTHSPRSVSPRNPDPEPVQPSYTAPTELRYQAGMRVKHPKWGEGMVISSKIDGPDELVEIMFEGVGSKLLIAALANLETL
jgi:DNA helicase-2/ATP-dependent DNA helicase PcrA